MLIYSKYPKFSKKQAAKLVLFSEFKITMMKSSQLFPIVLLKNLSLIIHCYGYFMEKLPIKESSLNSAQ